MHRQSSQRVSRSTLMKHPNQEYYEELLQRQDDAYQEIEYVKYARSGNVFPPQPIGLQKALRETRELEWASGDSISFSNGRNKDAVLFMRREADRWYVEVPILTEDIWDGYFWYGIADTARTMGMIRLFFDEAEWFEMLDFKMSRREPK